ncbi:MAG: GatB/Yqey domain protein [Candidatus Gottesmanbacteria bacterium GW2011_GWA1_43_11]|uniref:GatB/Yqey domain protein n=1 Tax=Candidatus Gottesmanbacteria bacterium GW2011_GWA1_43_11 TaxID=1618436 RepID=A0A0G1CGC5_9BACT|nr:MAG: GatB/Yqey domain protein [Candidatus Gottesmanbacteria bacterium GW2011_GWA1_43_11]
MLFEQLKTDLVTAMKSGERLRVDTLRYLIAAIKKYEIDTYPPATGGTLTEADVVKTVQKQVKTHRESIAAFQKGNRQDLVQKEQQELTILEEYLPKELTDAEIKTIVTALKNKGITNFGQLMGIVMKEVGGRASGDRVAAIVKSEL